MKFRFWMSYTSKNGKSYGAGIAPGYGVHVRGWNAGVKVTPREYLNSDNKDTDAFEVYVTAGSHGGARDIRLGRVLDTKDGAVWMPDNAACAKTLLASVEHVSAAE